MAAYSEAKSEGAPGPDPRRGDFFDWMVVIILLATSLVSMIDRFALSLLLEPIKADMGLNDTQLGLLTGLAFGLFYAAMSFPMGMLADRWSRKSTIILGLGVWGIATAGCGLAVNASQFAVARMLVGIGEAALAPCAYGMIHDRFPSRSLGRAMSVYQMGGMLGAGFAMFVAGIAYNYFLLYGTLVIPGLGALKPWQQTFIALALPCVPAIAMIMAIRDTRPVPGARNAQSPKDVSLLAELGRNGAFYFCALVGVSAIILVTYALLNWIPSVLIREFHWAAVDVGRIYGTMVVITSVSGLFAGGTVVDLMMHKGVPHPHLILSLIVAIVSLVLIGFLGASKAAVPSLIIVGTLHFVMATPIGIIPAYVQMISPAGLRGRLSSLYVLTVNIVGLAIGPSMIGFLSSLNAHNPRGLRLSVVEVGAISLLCAILLLVLARRILKTAGDFGDNTRLTVGDHANAVELKV